MSLPALDKTWAFVTNVDLKEKPLVADAAHWGLASYQNVMYTIKAQLILWGWSVEGSCDGAAFNMTGTDLWVDYTKLKWTGAGSGVGSWIVLKKTDAAGVGKHCYLLIRLLDEVYYAEVVVSWSPFIGGTTLLGPTSSGSFNVLVRALDTYTSETWIKFPTSYTPALPSVNARGVDVVFHSMRSTDGEVERIIICCNNITALYISLEKVKTPVSGWTHPFLITWVGLTTGTNGGVTSYAILNDASPYLNAPVVGCHNGNWMTCHYSSEAHVSAMVGERITYYNEISGEYTMCPVGIVSNSPGLKGHHGFLYDVWWGSTETLTGDTFPGDETQQFAQFTNLIFPWDGSTPVTV